MQLATGTQVTVVRTDGSVEMDWEIRCTWDFDHSARPELERIVVAKKDSPAHKHVLLSELEAWQKA